MLDARLVLNGIINNTRICCVSQHFSVRVTVEDYGQSVILSVGFVQILVLVFFNNLLSVRKLIKFAAWTSEVINYVPVQSYQ